MTWPSTYPYGSLGYMRDRIADELARDDLSTQINEAISDAIRTYQKEVFRFNDTFTTKFMTSVGQQNYTAMTDVNFPAMASPQQFYHISWATITVPPAVFDLPRIDPEQLLILTQTGTQQGQPYCFAYANETIMLYPVPSSGGPGQIQSFSLVSGGAGYSNGSYTNQALTGGTGNSATANIIVVGGIITNVAIVNPGLGYLVNDVLTVGSGVLGPGTGFAIQVTGTFTGATGPYLITLGGHVAYQLPTTIDGTTNRWMTDGERLIRSRAKYNIATHVTRNEQMRAAMSPDAPGGATYEAYRELRVEANRIMRRGVMRAMPF